MEVDVDQFAEGQHGPAIDQKARDLPRNEMHADAEAFECPGLATLKPQETHEITSRAWAMDSQGSDEPLLTRCNVHDARVTAEFPRLEKAQLKRAKVADSHWHPQIQRDRELEQS